MNRKQLIENQEAALSGLDEADSLFNGVEQDIKSLEKQKYLLQTDFRDLEDKFNTMLRTVEEIGRLQAQIRDHLEGKSNE